MVEKSQNTTTQLPQADGDSEPVFMHGSTQQFKDAIKEELEEADLNQLELALLDKALEIPEECAPKVADLLRKVLNRLADQRRARRVVSRVLPLFEKHDFWST